MSPNETEMNIHSRGTPFLNQVIDAVGSAATLQDILTVSPTVTFILWGRFAIDWNTGLTVKTSTHANTLVNLSINQSINQHSMLQSGCLPPLPS